MMGASSSSKATNQAKQAEGMRQENINRSVGQINQIYGSPQREADINDFLGATRSFYGNELERQKGSADRSLKFAMARSGLTGGSASVDANRTLGENYQQGILNADRLAQSAASDLRSADEQSRMNLISLAQSGADTTTGAAQAASALRTNLGGANAQLKADALGNVFGGVADIYKKSENAAAERRGYRDTWGYYQPGYGQGGKT